MRPGNICPSAGSPGPDGGCGGLPETPERTALPQGAETLAAEASAAARDTEGAVEQAAARATATACAVIQTPTNALGYLFYGAAAAAYSKGRGTEDASRWDDLARAELEQALEELRAVSVPDEPNPAKINWNC